MFGLRIKEERERLGFSQAQFAAIGLVTTRSQQNYEISSRKPDIAYLQAISKVGVDVLYIINGVHSASALASDEERLLVAYRNASPSVKAFMLQGINSDDVNLNKSRSIQNTGHVAIGSGIIQINRTGKGNKGD